MDKTPPCTLRFYISRKYPSIAAFAAEIGWSRMQEGDGNSTYRNRIIDAICNMDGQQLEEGAKYEIR